MKFNFLRETRRNLYFAPDIETEEDGEITDLEHVGIVLTEDGEIKIAKGVYASREDAQKWLSDQYQKLINGNGKDHPDRSTKILQYDGNVIKQMGEPGEAEWETIKRLMVKADKFKKEDIASYEVKLANNQVDRDNERFHEDVLRSFQKSLVGKAFLIGHTWGPPGRGRFFAAAVETIDGVMWLLGKFYLLKNYNQELIDHVDAGIWNWVSIGFRVPKRVPIYDSNDSEKIKYWELQNTDKDEAEAFEGSLVWLGSQYGAEIRKGLHSPLTGNILFKDQEDVVGYIQTADGIRPVFGKEIGLKREWTTAYINTFEDNCFAIIEPTGQKDNDGRTLPKTARHLPHHAKGDGAAGTGGKVDLSHLRNALARMNQITAVTDKITTEDLRNRAKKHLIAHAKKEGIGDYDILEISDNNEEVKLILEDLSVERILKAFGLDLKIDTEEDIQKAADTLETKRKEFSSAAEFVAALRQEFGETVTLEDLKTLKSIAGDAKKYREFLVDEIIKYGTLLEMIEKSAVENERKFYSDLAIERLEKERGKLMKKYDDTHPGKSVLSDNVENKSKSELKEVKGGPGSYQAPI